MKILVIKQTSLGDVLHATGHVRAIKQAFPNSELALLTATSSADIFRHNPWVDRMILVDRYRVKKNWWRRPGWSYRHMRDVMTQVRKERFDLAFDLQGLAKSVLFLYGARAEKKYVKGNWLGLKGFRDKRLHAITEMDKVIALAGVKGLDTSMEFARSNHEVAHIDRLLKTLNPAGKPIVIASPFSRWQSKDWPLSRFCSLAEAVAGEHLVLFTGAKERASEVEEQLGTMGQADIINLLGTLSLLEFAELASRATLMVCGDSFPMHVASACGTPVIALFGPTDDRKVGPKGGDHQVIVAPDCMRCDRKNW